MTSRERMKRKAVEDVLDAETSFKDADSTSGMCLDLEYINKWYTDQADNFFLTSRMPKLW